MFVPRIAQQQVLAYQSGKMGVSAVPGSGKTHTLSSLAAKIIAEGNLRRGQQILIVTLVNSAVDNFKQRIETFTQKRGLLPNMGYRVRTLHGLANDIVRERPDLAGLSDEFVILDESERDTVLKTSTQNWMTSHPEFIYDWTDESCDLTRSANVKNKDWPSLVVDTSSSFIRQAKDLQVGPAEIRKRITALHKSQPLLNMCCDIYSSYQQALRYRSAVDFDDLIRMALQALQSDEEYLDLLRFRWPFILEDEAQDSSRLQEEILRLLAGEGGNWVRVGDPNQAIFETFTTANPKYLLNFLNEPGVQRRELPNSGRSTRSIIRLANRLIRWTRDEHPVLALREALVTPEIREADGPNDPQPNPQDRPDRVIIMPQSQNSDAEINRVVKSIKSYLPENPDSTIAVLVTSNHHGKKVVDALREQGLEYVELLRSTTQTREVTTILASILRCLAYPTHSGHLADAYTKVYYREANHPDTAEQVKQTAALISHLFYVEDYLKPRSGANWLDKLPEAQDNQSLCERLESFRDQIMRWQAATTLPSDELILLIAQDLFTEAVDVALAYKIARVVATAAAAHPDWNLPEFSTDLDDIANHRRKLTGFSDGDTGFDPDRHKGKVVVATVHKAKGLEWDRVYLVSVNNYDYPSCQPGDRYIGEKWFVRRKQDLAAETLARLKALMQEDVSALYMEEGAATEESRVGYSAERLRLLYVGITRAKKELVITWNTGRDGKCTEALPLSALRVYLEEEKHHAHPA